MNITRTQSNQIRRLATNGRMVLDGSVTMDLPLGGDNVSGRIVAERATAKVRIVFEHANGFRVLETRDLLSFAF